MRFNKKVFVPICLFLAVVVLASMTLIQQTPREEDQKAVNLKVLPKHISHKDLDKIMGQWASSLGVKCNFCHARNDETKKMDFASDAKPEKKMAREMYIMSTKINKKYFKSGDKDSIGVAKLGSVNCYTCHRGVAHLEEATWPKRGGGPGMPPAGAPGMGGPNAQPKPQGSGR
ncbi:c-type cytochrome [Mucilaginibacter sp. UR6-11]|uniref:c-type cytochrome n=1 Tax=Mucilaginibacter sp. UR6-11 TaxID=1435644 RepID=UPI001E3848EA|nr:c-type cytochrome [Mucilaginibacter sp. UR6-11]MCC8423365.1 c-type cytochrome [Mucilaginibacter sp. UR6-11]